MGHYLINFSIYTLAMVGLIFFALFLYKKCSVMGVCARKNGYLKVVDMLSVSPRKAFYILQAGNEKFLVASDADRMNLISKLEKDALCKEEE